jgi:hypothetical protein
MNDLHLLEVRNFDKKTRIGIIRDGGYVVGLLDGSYDCYISAGVSNEESFSRDFIDMYSMNESNCFAFDGTITAYPHEYTNDIAFIHKNIGSVNDDSTSNLTYYTKKYKNIFLKMDIEGAEYPWILSLDKEDLDSFKQIVIELHGITDNGWHSSYAEKVTCLQKLSTTHYLIHAHGNNHAPVVNSIPDVIELTYVNKRYFSSIPPLNTRPLPQPALDFPNSSENPVDISLCVYPFVHPTP